LGDLINDRGDMRQGPHHGCPEVDSTGNTLEQSLLKEASVDGGGLDINGTKGSGNLRNGFRFPAATVTNVGRQNATRRAAEV